MNTKKIYLTILIIFLIVFGICVAVYIARHENKKYETTILTYFEKTNYTQWKGSE